MDDADRASEQEELFRLEARQHLSTKLQLRPIGFCYNCADMIEKPQTFCCPDCHKDYERRWALNHREELAPGELKRLLDDDDRQTRMEERKREQAEAYRGSATEPGEYDSQTPRRLSRRGV